jgi:hypothetical protein
VDYRYRHFCREALLDDLIFHAGPAPGRSVPDFDLPTVSGGRVRKADFLGRRPLLITFASLTDPMAASAAPSLKRLCRRVGEAVAFVTVYVREAHPGRRIPQPETQGRKLEHARLLRERDGLPWTVAVDDLDGAFHRAMGGNSSSAFVVDPNGDVAFRTLWSNDEEVLGPALEAIASGELGQPFERERRIIPLARGLARVDDVVRAAGPDAVEAVRREMPLAFAAAELAWAWRALSPLGRLAVGAAGVAGIAVLYAVARFARRGAPRP